MEDGGALCQGCWPDVSFIARPYCETCGRPFEFELGDGALCGACVRTKPLYDRARSVFVYDQESRDLILAFKHADQTHAAGAFGRWLSRAGAELLEGADYLVPVPLHWTRLYARRYNQAQLLARAIGAQMAIPVAARALVRKRKTPPHVNMSAAKRFRNVRGAFHLHPKAAAMIDGKHIVLIDDVLTTGATVSECSKMLKSAGAIKIDVLTLARVARAEES